MIAYDGFMVDIPAHHVLLVDLVGFGGGRGVRSISYRALTRNSKTVHLSYVLDPEDSGYADLMAVFDVEDIMDLTPVVAQSLLGKVVQVYRNEKGGMEPAYLGTPIHYSHFVIDDYDQED